MKFVGEGAPTSAYWGYLQVGAPTLPFSLLGCDNIYYAALAAPVTLRAFGSTQSKWEVPLKVPNDPGLIGAVAVAQTAYLWLPDPLKNLRLTNGVRLTVGR